MDGNLNLSKIWEEAASARWKTDFDDINNELAGGETKRFRRLLGENNSFVTSAEKKDHDETDLMMEWLNYVSESYRRAFESFMKTADKALEFYDDSIDELDQMKTELDGIKAEYAKRTIHLSDGREVYVDQSGNYVYQNTAGTWQNLEDAAVPEARAKHQALGSQAITKQQKVDLDKYETDLNSTTALMQNNRENARSYEEKAKNRELSEDELKKANEEIKQDQKEAENSLNAIKQGQQNIKSGLASYRQTAPQQETSDRNSFTDNEVGSAVFGNDLNSQTELDGISASGSSFEGAGALTEDFNASSTGSTQEQPSQQPAFKEKAPAVSAPALGG